MRRLVRTFVAVDVSPEVRTRTAQAIARLQAAEAKVTWIAPQRLHLTLNFLGDVNQLELPAVCQAVVTAVHDFPQFEYTVKGVGVFPSPDNPRTLWLGVEKGADELREVQAAIQQALSPLGFRPEARRYRPHLTIGRVRGKREGLDQLSVLLAELGDYQAGVVAVDEITVYSSDFSPATERDGPMYEALAGAPLCG